MDEEGIPRFQLLQKWQKRPTAPVCFYLFNLLWSDGRDLTGKTIVQRRERLEQIITPVDGIQVSGYIEKRGINLFQLAKEKGLEGIIAKRKKSTYQPGRRSLYWLKIKSRPPEASATRTRQYAHSAGRLWRSTRQVVDAARSESRQPQLLLTVKDCLLT